ncbi:MAG: extracellular solute-binding protein [Anaerolineae bacterium]
MYFREQKLFRGFVIVLLMMLVILPAAAQADTVLQVVLPNFLRPNMNDTVFQPFEDDHPGVRVEVVYTDFDILTPPLPANDLTGYLDAMEKYLSMGDVVTVQNGNMAVEGTRAGYFLDLLPLTSADINLNIDDFLPAVWQSFQWDNGLWALPVSEDVITVVYDKQIFDEKRLAYPDENWTVEDFAAAADALALRDENGKVTVPGLVTYQNEAYLFRSLVGAGFYDPNAFPDGPLLVTPLLDEVLTRANDLYEEGIVSSSFDGNVGDVPFKIINTFGLLAGLGAINQGDPQAALLPGGVAGIEAQGFAVSSGTRYPELAYELAAFMTESPTFAANPFGVAPARRSLVGVDAPDNGTGANFVGRRNFSPENQAVIDQALENGIPYSEMRYSSYVWKAALSVRYEGLSAQDALQNAEAEAVANLQTAEARATDTLLLVATPIPQVALQTGEISLKFGVQSFVQPLPNNDAWQSVIADFVSTDPQVAEINVDVQGGFGGVEASTYAKQDDCFYLPYNAVPNIDLTLLFPLDPYLDADPAFDRSDQVGNALELVSKDNQTWALPIVVQPEILWFNKDLFERNGIPTPTDGWTIDQFADAVKLLKINPDDPPPFVPSGAGANHLLMLAAAYGGVPIDQRTSPPTLNYLDPSSVDALRQVLDLAKDGYIQYKELARPQFTLGGNTEGDTPPIYTESLNGFSFQFGAAPGSDSKDGYALTTYPSGSQYNAVSFDIGTGYISADTQNPDACYRWITNLANHPELFSAMPARRLLINDPAFAASTDANTIALYQRFDSVMASQNTINFQSPFGGGTNPADFIVEYWLFKAFDNYVLRDADLETELETAQTFGVGYQECVATIPPRDPDQELFDYFRQFLRCAAKIDPELGALIGAFAGS